MITKRVFINLSPDQRNSGSDILVMGHCEQFLSHQYFKSPQLTEATMMLWDGREVTVTIKDDQKTNSSIDDIKWFRKNYACCSSKPFPQRCAHHAGMKRFYDE